MADEIAVDSFLNLLGQSELVSDDQLVALMAEFRGDIARWNNSRELANELVRREILTAWQADMLLQKKNRGFRLGQYRILRPLGQGGMSKVFLAEHETMRRRSAIKILPSKYEGDADLLNRFRLEAIAVARLDHPNIVRAWDFNKDVRYGKEIHYLAMEYVEGPDLRRMVEEYGPLDYRTAADCIAQAAEGLAHAHAAGFVHRDIKPANLLVDSHGVLKVLDLGLAMFTMDNALSLGASDGGQSAVGTADYAAPEQVLDSQNVDCRADIYGLGYTFYFLLTGRRPFPKATVMEILTAHQVEKHEPVGNFRPDVPPELEAIIDKMTGKLPLQRFQSAKEVAERLRAWLRESESGRSSYSRISALMAEAARAKQSSSNGLTPAPTKPTMPPAELELATVDDEPSGSSSAVSTKSGKLGQPKAAGATPAEARDPNRPSAVRKAVPLPPRKPATKQAKSPSGRLLPDDLISALPPPEVLSPASGSLPRMGQRPAPKGTTVEKLLKSPWTWIGVGAAVLLVVLLLLVVLFSTSGPERSGENAGQVERVTPGLGQTPPAVRPIQPPQPPSLAPPSPSPTVAAPAATPPPQATAGGAPGKPPPSVPPHGELSVAEPLASLTEIGLGTGLQSVNVSLVRFYPAIGPAAFAAAERLHLRVTDNAAAVLVVDMQADETSASPNIKLLLELMYTLPDGKRVTLWKGSKQLVAVDLSTLTTENEVQYKKIAATKTNELFKELVDAVLQARAKAKAK